MDKIKYAAVLKINDLDNMTDEESKRWNRFLQLSPTARGYVLKAIEQGIDILFCFSKESLFNRYNSHFDISVVSEYLNLQPKKVLLKGKIANYYTEQGVAILDEFM